MATIKEFECIRPRADLAKRIAALPYDVYNREEAKREVEKEPLSFLRIDRAETQLSNAVDIYDEAVYLKASETLHSMIDNGEFIHSDTACLYIYQLVWEGRSQTGIVACASVDDYVNQMIKKHENTRSDKELDRIKHVETCMAQTGPIFLAYRENQELKRVIENVKKRQPIYDFISEDGIRHTVWEIALRNEIEMIKTEFAGISNLYIADGHHRAASAVKVALRKREENLHQTGEEEYNYVLSVLFADNELMIMDYNRVVHDLNGYSKEEFLCRLQDVFEVQKQEEMYKPDKAQTFGMYLGREWYRLGLKNRKVYDNPRDRLDVSILQNEVLAPILGITDPKTDQRIHFVGGVRGLKELEKDIEMYPEGVAFAMYPTSIEDLFDVADANLLMPPKSTWFEPKIRSGLFIHRI